MVWVLRIHRLARLTGLAAIIAIVALAQSPTFEAASIKLSGPQSVRGWKGGPGTSDPGQYSFGQATVLDLIGEAYHIDDFTRISSATALDEQRFDLVAKLPTGATKEQFRGMLRILLAERFHLKVHVVSREFAVFELRVAKGGPKLKPSDAANAGPPRITANYSGDGGFDVVHMRGQRASVDLLAKMLSRPGEPPFFDRTGLTDRYDFTLDYSNEYGVGAPASVPPVPDLPVALREQLGLQTVRAKAPLDVVVVDSVDKLPTAN
jgi:uncharacterized protein (TIGR03435 family)